MKAFSTCTERRVALPASTPIAFGWTRWIALLCVLILGAASTAQAAHIHGLRAPSKAQQWEMPASGPDGPAGEEHCPLCVAMHSAVPAAIALHQAPLLAVLLLSDPCVEREGASGWHFPSFSRPPPLRG